MILKLTQVENNLAFVATYGKGSPFITTSNDIFGILIYFYIAKLILPI